MRFALTDPLLFAKKAVIVWAAAFALLPIVSLKHEMPALAYAGGLVVLHLFVIGIYVYRVRFRELDPDARALGARLLALAVVAYLLFAVSSFEEGAPLSRLALQMLGLSVLHTAVLLLLMGKVAYPQVERAPAPLPAEGAGVEEAVDRR